MGITMKELVLIMYVNILVNFNIRKLFIAIIAI